LSSTVDRLQLLWQDFVDWMQGHPTPKPEDLRYLNGLKVGLAAFGSPSKFNLLKAIAEFKQYVENNSLLKLDIHFVQDANLPIPEIKLYDSAKGCYMVTPDSLSSATKAKMPADMKTDIVVYDTQNLVNCVTGLTWDIDLPKIVVPFISIPYSNLSSWDFGWKTSLAPALVHEFNHAIYFVLARKGFNGLPDIDRATDLGYTEQNDPGWLRFRKYCFGRITQKMADALMEN